MKNIPMNRARFVALPAILKAARAATRHVPMKDRELTELEQALDAFREVP